MAARVWKGEVCDTEQALSGFGRVDYADCYLFRMPVNLGTGSRADRLDAVTRAMFDRTPGFVEALLRLRDAMVRPLGLKTGKELPPATDGRDGIEVGGRVGLFRVLARDGGEIVMGEQDKHLDFRVAVRLEDGGDGPELASVTTWVHYNNWLGPAYFFFVRPFHGLVVRMVMAEAARHLENPAISRT